MNKDELKNRLLLIKKEKGNYEKYGLNTGNRFNAVGVMDGINIALELIDKLDEKELPIIPQVIAEYLEDLKESGLNFFSAYQSALYFKRATQEQVDWLNSEENMEKFAIAWNGYTIKKDVLYLINFGENQYARKFNKTKIDSLLVIKGNAAEFTEKEIKAIDERYWAFAEPVE